MRKNISDSKLFLKNTIGAKCDRISLKFFVFLVDFYFSVSLDVESRSNLKIFLDFFISRLVWMYIQFEYLFI